ncbi:UNVERIFIED_ORG: hypothetical protein B5F06_06145 [Lacrimispora saccharolytica]
MAAPVFHITGNFVPCDMKNAPRGSHCGGEGYGCFAAPPQAKNPARQDSLFCPAAGAERQPFFDRKRGGLKRCLPAGKT